MINFLTLKEGYAKHPSIYYDKIEFIATRMLGEACPKDKEFYRFVMTCIIAVWSDEYVTLENFCTNEFINETLEAWENMEQE